MCVVLVVNIVAEVTVMSRNYLVVSGKFDLFRSETRRRSFVRRKRACRISVGEKKEREILSAKQVRSGERSSQNGKIGALDPCTVALRDKRAVRLPRARVRKVQRVNS